MLVLISLAVPLLLAIALSNHRGRHAIPLLLPVAALPVLALALLQSVSTLELPWLLQGTQLGVDELNRPLLLLAALIWTAVGCYARGWLLEQESRKVRFQLFYLLTLSGNVGVLLAQDVVGFYFFYALMAFATYGLIVHDGSPMARRAGRIYMALAVGGEALLLCALWFIADASSGFNIKLADLAAHIAEMPQRDLVVGLVLASFAVKMGSVPLHIWLPASYRCAPTPASAALGGIVIKAGLLGWLRFLPLGQVALPEVGEICIAVGMLSAFYGALVGVLQERPKTVVAYSSISQMGLLTALLGVALTAPAIWPSLVNLMVLFSLHHGIAKAALFLGVDVAGRNMPGSGWLLTLPALALAGAPLTSGAVAKLGFKEAGSLAPGDWSHWMPLLLTLSSGATTLLMARLLYLAWPRQSGRLPSPWLLTPWLGLLVALWLVPWWWSITQLPGLLPRALEASALLDSAGVLIGCSVVAVIVWGIGRITRLRYVLPEGDVVILGQWLSLWKRNMGLSAAKLPKLTMVIGVHNWNVLNGERYLLHWPVAGLGFLALFVVLVFLLVR
ncbi:MAG: complex I subunit 5 family protein [Candidatus Competibacteraceae bacterium]|jgi:formate hydrogenlyase subunit 3/multisubunit Na+/H+ antiporter MnhD subunit|nr:complex I subunit 5 family protein [Candidatus Competibacteraceae bacterium]